MVNKRLLVAVCLLALATTAFAVSGPLHRAVSFIKQGSVPPSKNSSQPRHQFAADGQAQPDNAAQSQAAEVPKHIIYGILFRERAKLNQKAHEKEVKGEDGSPLRKYHKDKLKLDDAQSAVLDNIADETNRKVALVDKKALKIIEAERSRHPGGKLKDGELPPPPPLELKTLQQERDALVLQRREQLRQALGDTEFQRVDEFLQQDITSKMQPVLTRR